MLQVLKWGKFLQVYPAMAKYSNSSILIRRMMSSGDDKKSSDDCKPVEEDKCKKDEKKSEEKPPEKVCEKKEETAKKPEPPKDPCKDQKEKKLSEVSGGRDKCEIKEVVCPPVVKAKPKQLSCEELLIQREAENNPKGTCGKTDLTKIRGGGPRCPCNIEEPPPKTGKHTDRWRKISLFAALPLVALLTIFVFTTRKEEERPEFQYHTYKYKRTKPYWFRDGNRTAFHNAYWNALPPAGYEDEIDEGAIGQTPETDKEKKQRIKDFQNKRKEWQKAVKKREAELKKQQAAAEKEAKKAQANAEKEEKRQQAAAEKEEKRQQAEANKEAKKQAADAEKERKRQDAEAEKERKRQEAEDKKAAKTAAKEAARLAKTLKVEDVGYKYDVRAPSLPEIAEDYDYSYPDNYNADDMDSDD